MMACRILGKGVEIHQVDGNGRHELVIGLAFAELAAVHFCPIVEGTAGHVRIFADLYFDIDLRAVVHFRPDIQDRYLAVLHDGGHFLV